jgi:hypothetical protein
MPVHVEKRGDEYLIIENATGAIKGRSKSRRDAEISASIRNRAIRGELSKEAIEFNINFFESEGFSTKKAIDLAFALL